MKRNLPINYKNFDLKAESIDAENRTVEFYAAVWGNKDAAGDILYKGCCLKSIQEHGVNSTSPQKILMLAYHDMSRPIGKLTEIEEDETGLRCKAEISKTQDGDEILTLLADGVINQFSIGFRYIYDKIKYDEAEDTYHVYEIKLMEVSAVSIGANEMTRVKSEAEAIEKETESYLKSLDQNIAAQIRCLLSKHYALGQADAEAITSTKSEPQDESKTEPDLIDWKQIQQSIHELNNLK